MTDKNTKSQPVLVLMYVFIVILSSSNKSVHISQNFFACEFHFLTQYNLLALKVLRLTQV